MKIKLLKSSIEQYSQKQAELTDDFLENFEEVRGYLNNKDQEYFSNRFFINAAQVRKIVESQVGLIRDLAATVEVGKEKQHERNKDFR